MGVASGSLSTVGNSVLLRHNGDQWALVSVTGAFTGAQITFQVSVDGVNFVSIPGVQIGGTVPPSSPVLPDNSQTLWRLTSGIELGTYLQVSLVAITTGSVGVSITSYNTQLSNTVGQNNQSPPLYQDQPMGNVGFVQDVATGSAANAVITYTAMAGQSHVISGITLSYSGVTPTGGNVQIKDGSSNVLFNIDLVAQGVQTFAFYPPKQGTAGAAMTITLASGGTSCVGKVNASHWTVQASNQGPQPMIPPLLMDFEGWQNSQWVAAL